MQLHWQNQGLKQYNIIFSEVLGGHHITAKCYSLQLFSGNKKFTTSNHLHLVFQTLIQLMTANNKRKSLPSSVNIKLISS